MHPKSGRRRPSVPGRQRAIGWQPTWFVKQDRRDEVLYYRTEAAARVAKKLVDAMKKALHALERQAGMDSPAIGQELDIDGLRAWRLDSFPLSLWHFERADHVLVVRLVGQRQDPDDIALVDN